MQSRSLEVAVNDHGIEPNHFIGKAIGSQPAPGDVWDWLVTQLRRYRTVPSPDLFARRWPDFAMPVATDPVEALCEEFMRGVARREGINELRSLSDLVDNPAEVGSIVEHFFGAARNLSQRIPSESHAERYSSSLSRRELYMLQKTTGFMPGISLLSDQINELTYGVQSHELAIIEAFLHVGKSSMAVGICGEEYFMHDRTGLYFSLEMEAVKLNNRWDALASKFDYKKMKRGELNDEELERWREWGEKAESSRFEKDVIVLHEMDKITVDYIYSKVERYRPDFFIVDSVDEVEAPKSLKSNWEKQAFVARELKAICRTTQIPCIGLAQAGREAEADGATLGNVAGSIDIARKADIVVGLHANQQMKKQKKMEVRALKLRDDEGQGARYEMFWNPKTLEFRRWLPSDNVPVVAAQPQTAFD